MGTRSRKHQQRRVQTPSQFRVAIELEAVMDYMTALRGMTAHGNFYEGFISDELLRYPSFDGSDWEELLPYGVSFADFLNDAVTGNNVNSNKLFEKVRPYDFTHSELAFLQRKNADITIYVPEQFQSYKPQIDHWFNQMFRDEGKFPKIKVENATSLPDQPAADIYVVRSSDNAQRLKDQGRPFVLIDGKENQHIRDAVRVLRWDQAGYLLRHAQLIDYVSKSIPDAPVEPSRAFGPLYPPHMNIWQSNPVVVTPVDDASQWIGHHIRSLELVAQDPQLRLRYKPRNGAPASTGRPYSPELARKVLANQEVDLAELYRKRELLRRLTADKFESICEHPSWVEKLRGRDENMRVVLSDLQKELGVDAVSGRKVKRLKKSIPVSKTSSSFTDRLINGSGLNAETFNRSFSEGIHLLAKNWDQVRQESYPGNTANVAGHLAELSTLLLLKDEGWKLLIPKEKNGEHSKTSTRRFRLPRPHKVRQANGRLSEFARVSVSWTDNTSGRTRYAEVDFIARGPNNFVMIGEVKLTSNVALSESQVALRNHLHGGGEINNPGLPGIRTKTFKPAWREIHVDDGPLMQKTPVTTLQQMTRTHTI